MPIPHSFAIGAILCPTIKLDMFKMYVDIYYDSLEDSGSPMLQLHSKERYKESIETFLYTMYDSFYAKHTTNFKKAGGSSSSSSSFGAGTKIRKEHNHLQRALQNKLTNFTTQREELSELTQYFKTPFDMSMYDEDTPIDVLDWWSKKESMFPILSKMVKEIFCIPMSTIASESAFSMANLQYTQRRSRLTSSAIEVCVAIKDWTAAEHRMQDNDAMMEEKEKDMFENLSDIEEDVEQEELDGQEEESEDESEDDEFTYE